MIISLFLSLITILSPRTIYMCNDSKFEDSQCLKKEKLGSNTFYWLRKCESSKVCVQLPYYGGIIGSCQKKLKLKYDGEKCNKDGDCTSKKCKKGKCKGKTKGINCEPGLRECKKGLLCRKENYEDSIFQCLTPIEEGQNCGELTDYQIEDSNSFYLYDDASYFDPAYNPCKLGYTCTHPNDYSRGKCVKIGSIKSEEYIILPSNPLSCESGFIKYDETGCANNYLYATGSSIYDDAVFPNMRLTSKGSKFKYYDNVTYSFNEWINAVNDNNMKDSDAVYEAFRYNRNNKKINQLWFRYTHAHLVLDSDDCAFDFFFKNSFAQFVNNPFLFLIFFILF